MNAASKQAREYAEFIHCNLEFVRGVQEIVEEKAYQRWIVYNRTPQGTFLNRMLAPLDATKEQVVAEWVKKDKKEGSV